MVSDGMACNTFDAGLLLVLATSTTSLTVTRSSLFKGAREWAAKKNEWLGDLLACPYCFSHWAAFLYVIPITGRASQALSLNPILAWWFTAMAIVAVSAPVMYAIVICQRGMRLTEKG